MLALYVVCLILGGGLLLFSVLGLDSDGDVDVEGAEPDAEGHDAHHAGGEWGMAREFLSVRTLFYFLAAFGATGLLLETLTDASSLVAAAGATATGVLAALAAAAIYWSVRSTESGILPVGHEHLVGLPAEVVVPVLESRRGKIRVLAGDRQVELLARLYGAEDADCPRGATVVIVDIVGDTALITPAPSLPADTY